MELYYKIFDKILDWHFINYISRKHDIFKLIDLSYFVIDIILAKVLKLFELNFLIINRKVSRFM